MHLDEKLPLYNVVAVRQAPTMSRRFIRLGLFVSVGCLMLWIYSLIQMRPRYITDVMDLERPNNGSNVQWASRRPIEIFAENVQISDEAHKMPFADDFRGGPHVDEYMSYYNGHFDNVTLLPAVSLVEAKADCAWDDSDPVNLSMTDGMVYLDTSWISKDRKEEELKKWRKKIHDYIRGVDGTLVPYDTYADRFTGRGIVIVGGARRSIERIKVTLRQLKKLGCKLPVEIHYWGAEMKGADRQALLAVSPEVRFNNLAGPHNILPSSYDPTIGVHFHLKNVALINAGFEEILLLDSDNIPMINPEELFESPTYQEYGTVFWPDIMRTRANNPMWSITNTACRSKTEWELESGQLMVNKRKFFYHLQLAAWFITPNTERYTYFHSVMLGDKDTFRFAWHALKTRFGTPDKWLASVGTLSGDWYCGHSFAQHHPDDDRVAFLHGGFLKRYQKGLLKWHKEVNGGVHQVYKDDPRAKDTTSNPRMQWKLDGRTYVPPEYTPEGGFEAGGMCIDFVDLPARPFRELVPGDVFDGQRFEDIGGYWALN